MRHANRGKLRQLALAVSIVLFLLTAGLEAQVDTGAILGTVKDSTGGTIAGAAVSITHEGTGLKLSSETRVDGTYVFTPVRIGSYTVEVSFTGFQKARRAGVQVNIQQQAIVDFSLLPGELTQTVEVTAALPVLQTT